MAKTNTSLTSLSAPVSTGEVIYWGSDGVFKRVTVAKLFSIAGSSSSVNFMGFTSSTADPTTSDLGSDKDMSIHKNTTSGDIFIAYNNGGNILAVRLNDPVTVAFTIAAGGSNVCEIQVAITDFDGDTIAEVFNFEFWLSDAATGAGLTATSASGTVQAKSASGTDLETVTSKKHLRVQTLATGLYTIEITDTAKTGFYIAVKSPATGKTVVSRQLVTGDYG